ncbi:MAG: hypothetical protein L0G70_03845 [Rubrobacter sp.]|nr:hypothetical protein [Rubrobacter sp.]
MTESNTTGRIESTISSLKQGAMQMAVDKAREEVAGWRQMLQDSGEQQLTPISDNLSALETALSLQPLDGPAIGRLMRTLAEQTREVAASDLVSNSDQEVANRLQSLAQLLDDEGASISDVGPLH